MDKLLDKLPLDGYKAHIAGALIILAGILFSLGWLDRDTFELVVGVLAGASVIGLRHAISKK